MRQILHLSDVHFGPPHRSQVSDGVHELVRRRPPDLVVISGDLTQRAKPEQFRQARAFVDRFEVPTLTVPGNHDVPMYRVWERALAPFDAYRKHFATDLEPSFEDEELAVIGVNSAFNWTVKDGHVMGARLRRLRKALDETPPGLTKIVVAHHPMVPPPRFDTQRVLMGASAVIDVLAEAGVELVLSGHLHQAWVGSTEAYYPAARRPVLLAHSGTSTSRRGRGCERKRNTCNWIRVSEEETEVSHLAWDGDGRFNVESRHCFPRRGGETYALESL